MVVVPFMIWWQIIAAWLDVNTIVACVLLMRLA